MKSVYLIKSLDSSYYKVGVSKTPIKRLGSIQTGNPSELNLLYEYYSDNAHTIERVWHRLHSHVKKYGEWYDLSINDEIKFIDDCKQIDENIKLIKKGL